MSPDRVLCLGARRVVTCDPARSSPANPLGAIEGGAIALRSSGAEGDDDILSSGGGTILATGSSTARTFASAIRAIPRSPTCSR